MNLKIIGFFLAMLFAGVCVIAVKSSLDHRTDMQRKEIVDRYVRPVNEPQEAQNGTRF